MHSLVSHFDLAEKKHKIQELTSMTLQDDFWSDSQHAQTLIRQLNGIKDIVESYERLNSALEGLEETHDLLKEDYDDEIFELFEAEYLEMEKNFDDFEIKILLSHEYDHSSAILELHPGAGGTESCDWADMLYRMYSRWAEKKGFKVSVLDYLPGEEAGIKSVTFLVEGDMAYGYLKAEKGVHRLVRISPFDSGGRRHTSFASLDVMPQFNNEIEIEIKPEDLIVETKRASGAGGQHINKTDSAVRIVHKPTGIVVKCQDGRSQHENRATALMTIRSRVYEEHQRKLEEEQGVERRSKIGTGDRAEKIRTYNYPQNRVTDHRIGYTVNQLDRIMEGRMQDLLDALLSADQQAKLAGEK